jgi:4a-hydroxytetrahydrobiopterin dehydratase
MAMNTEQPKSGVLDATEVGRALEARPHWRWEDGRLVREVRFPDFPAALAFVNRLADEAEHFGRRPDVAIAEGGHVRLSIVNAHHLGLTVEELALADKAERVVEGDRTAL